jgi:purine-binding chemotaxis protein CheW
MMNPADPDAIAREPGDSMHVVEFRLGSQIFGGAIESLSEIQPFHEVTPMPCVPPFILGLINVRGVLLPLLDLRQLLDSPPGAAGRSDQILVVDAAGMTVGFPVDAVLGVAEISLESLQSATGEAIGMKTEFVRGITEQNLIVLDFEKILSNEALLIYEEP